MSEYLREINEFWQEYLKQYNSIYDQNTLEQIIKNDRLCKWKSNY